MKANISLASPDNLGAHICDVELILRVTLSASGSNCSAVVLDPTLGCCALLMCLMIKLWMQLISSAGLCSPPMTHRRQTPALWLYVGHVRDILLSRIVGGCVSLYVLVFMCWCLCVLVDRFI